MQILMAVIVGGLYAAGLYLMMRRSIVKLIIGLAVLSHATNLLIFVMGGPTRGRPPIIAAAADRMIGTYSDPLSQAMILTAIVIGFGVQAFAVVLIRRTHERIGTDDLDELQTTDTL